MRFNDYAPAWHVFGQPFAKRFALSNRTVVMSVCPWRWCTVARQLDDQDETWHAGRPWPRPHCVGWGSSSPRKGAQQPPTFEIYGRWLYLRPKACVRIIRVPCLLWPNGWMDQDETLYGGRPGHQPNCVKWGPSSPPPKGHTHNFWPMSVVAKQLNRSRGHLIGR